ncbi:hypothetical protein SprV_0301193400 [Sparganum proliferum]
MLTEHESVVNQQKLIELIEHLSSTQNWELCSSLLVENLERCNSLAVLNDFQNSAAFFVCCRSVEVFIKAPITSRPVTQVEVQKVSAFITRWIRAFISCCSGHATSQLIKKKVAQFTCLSIIRYYPQHWPTAFSDVLAIFSDFSELDSFVLNRDVQLTSEEVSRANSIKDSMRVTCLPAIIHTVTQFMRNLDANEPSDRELISSCLQTLGLYASWIDVSLIVNVEFFSILGTLVCCPAPSLLSGISLLLKGLVCKGMAPFPDKLSLIIGIWSESLEPVMSVPFIARVIANAPPQPSNPRLTDVESESPEVLQFLEDFSTLLGSIGYNLVEAYRYLVSSNGCGGPNTVDTSIFSRAPSVGPQALHSALDQCLKKLETVFDVSISFLAHPDSNVSQGVLPFIGDYLSLLKTGVASDQSGKLPKSPTTNVQLDGGKKILLELNESRQLKLDRLLRVLLDKIKCPTDANSEEMEDFEEDRQEFLGIVRSIARIHGSLVLKTIQTTLQSILTQLSAVNAKDLGDDNLAHLDACLYLFFSLGEFLKAPRNDHFSQAYVHGEKMTEIMTSICDSSISSINYFPVQLNFFEIIGRYDKFFNTHPKLLLNVMVAFLDGRGLRNPRANVRCRCAYLFSRLVKSHRTTLAPHAEQILRELEGLLPLDPTPELPSQRTVGLENGTTKPLSNGAQHQKFISITEQSFLYESAAHLILASTLRNAAPNGNGENATDSQTSHLFAMLLRPIMMQFPELVRLLAAEKDPIVAESRGVVVKQAADLITRTTRVMSAQSPLNAEFIPLFIDILNVMVNSMTYLPTAPGSPGRGAACTGIRAYLHRLIVCIGPDCTMPCQPSKDGHSNGGLSSASEWLMLAISSIMPQLIGVNQDGTALVGAAEADIDQRWRELRDNMPLFNQIASRYKERSLPFLTACLPPLVGVTLNALSEPLHETQFVAMDERKCLRRNFLQMLQGISQVLPQGLLVALGPDAANVLMSIVALTDACLVHDDAVGIKAGFALFTAIVPVCAQEAAFYEGFILSHLLPLCFLLPARPEFRLNDAQFVLALNESVGCIHVINSVKGQVFQDFLQSTFLPQQNLSTQYIESYVNNLRSNSLAEFQVFVKNFYSSFR